MRKTMVMLLFICVLRAGWTAPIHDAARQGDIAAVSKLLQADPLQMEARVDRETPPIWHNPSIINLNETSNATPLLVAAHAGQLEMVKWLVEHGANLSVYDDTGNLLSAAACSGSLPMLRYVIEQCNFAPDGPGGHVLYTAALTGSLEEVQYLIETAGANPYALSYYAPYSVLESAAEGGSLPIVHYLLNHGIDFTTCRNGIQSVFSAALRGGSLPMALLV